MVTLASAARHSLRRHTAARARLAVAAPPSAARAPVAVTDTKCGGIRAWRRAGGGARWSACGRCACALVALVRVERIAPHGGSQPGRRAARRAARVREVV